MHCDVVARARKVIERSLDKEIQSHFTPNVMQMGFHAKLGTEMAIAQTEHAITGGRKWIAVLDLRSAYDTVRRDLLIERCRKVVPYNLAAMISHILQPLYIRTIGDESGKQCKIDRGVTQGGPRGPTLFNIFIDTPATDLESNLGNGVSQMPARLYADDVIIHVKNMTDLQCALLICENWAQRVGMTWARSKGKSQVVLSRRTAERYKHFPFAGGTIETVTEAQYFGVIISTNGIMSQSMKERIQMAHATPTTLQNAKLLFAGIDL